METISLMRSILSILYVCGGHLDVNSFNAFKTAKYEIASSNTTRPTFAIDACFVWKLAPLADERSGFLIENLSRRLTRSSTY
jgi:hypothetical protein